MVYLFGFLQLLEVYNSVFLSQGMPKLKGGGRGLLPRLQAALEWKRTPPHHERNRSYNVCSESVK
jgi:hypothetical protein